MKVLKEPRIKMPLDIDEQCLELCDILNRLPFVETRESCAGHGNHPFWIFFNRRFQKLYERRINYEKN